MVMRINETQNTNEGDNLSQILLQKNLLSPVELQQAQSTAKNFKQTLFQYIMQYRLVDASQLLHTCSNFFQLPENSLQNKKIDKLFFNALPFHIIENNLLLPIFKKGKILIIAIANPNDIGSAKRLSFQLGLSVQFILTRYDTLYRIHNAYVSEQKYRQLQDKNDCFAQTLVYQLLSDAIHRDASDIHFEPHQTYCRIRFRVDGLLHEIIHLPSHLTDEITSCLKVLSHMDIAIKRTPQDGRLTFH